MNALELYTLTKDVDIGTLPLPIYREFTETEQYQMNRCNHNWAPSLQRFHFHCENGLSWKCLATYIDQTDSIRDYFYDAVPVTPEQLGLRS